MLNKRHIKIISIIILIAIVIYQAIEQSKKSSSENNLPKINIPSIGEELKSEKNHNKTENRYSGKLIQAINHRQSDVQVMGSGKVIHILPDDNKGSRHQKFIVKIQEGKTILIAHNIDLAPRINNLSKGDKITFFGEYEWTEKGGVVHWTHHDPNGYHIDGWLKHKNKTYQ